MTRWRLVAAASIVLAVAGCSTHNKSDTHTSPPRTTGAVTSPETTPSSTVGSSPVASSGSSTSAAVTTPPPPALPADYCKASQLRIMVLPGGAVQGYEIAAVTFTNTSSQTCSLAGYPTVELRHGAQVLATATPQSGTVPTLIHLPPAAQAQAQIRDHTTCQAPLSDSIHAVAPAPLTTLKVDSAATFVQMRGCTVTVEPIALSS